MEKPEQVILVCVPVNDIIFPQVPSFKDSCTVCGIEVWRSNRSVAMDALLQCLACSIKDMQKREEVEIIPAPYVADDIEELTKQIRESLN